MSNTNQPSRSIDEPSASSLIKHNSYILYWVEEMEYYRQLQLSRTHKQRCANTSWTVFFFIADYYEDPAVTDMTLLITYIQVLLIMRKELNNMTNCFM
jgi:hypothetical protein